MTNKAKKKESNILSKSDYTAKYRKIHGKTPV